MSLDRVSQGSDAPQQRFDSRLDLAAHRGGKLRRVAALVRKEGRQVVRDPSSIAIGIVLPVILILLFGYGLSLDMKDIRVALVVDDRSAEATEMAAGFQMSRYFIATYVNSMEQARELMLNRKADAILHVQSDFSRRLALGNAEVQLLVHGSDANRARIIQAYSEAALGTYLGRRAAAGQPISAGPINVQSQLWFNSANESRWFLVPGLIVLVMTLIGAMLTALVMAREWEHGTLEALFVTPVRADEILLGKTIPYFLLGMIGFALCVVATKFLFHVPLRGSIWVLTGASMLYLLVALGIGLVISALVKSQFVASQVAILVTFLPAMMLSGFLFDLRSMPAPLRLLTYALPARYYVALLQTMFLAGDVWPVILPNTVVLGVMAVLLAILTRGVTRKRLA
ncbi:MAG TPA: ABC transporter permease [Planctomycetaceae bacterium]|nr:ABC transporter permease [Planctomycetaceae bacterium]